MISYTPEQMLKMNRTARRTGAIGYNAVVPRLVKQMLAKGEYVLDYGCGKSTAHGDAIARETGASVDFYDIGANGRGEQLFRAMKGDYDLVYASNVLNVQPNGAAIFAVLCELRDSVHRAGVIVFNYPTAPRHSTATNAEVVSMARRAGLHISAAPHHRGAFIAMRA